MLIMLWWRQQREAVPVGIYNGTLMWRSLTELSRSFPDCPQCVTDGQGAVACHRTFVEEESYRLVPSCQDGDSNCSKAVSPMGSKSS